MRRNNLLATGMLSALLAVSACSAPTDAGPGATDPSAGTGIGAGAHPDERPTADVGASQLAAAERARREAARNGSEEAGRGVETAPGTAAAEPAETSGAQDGAGVQGAPPAAVRTLPAAGPAATPSVPAPSPAGSRDADTEDADQAVPDDADDPETRSPGSGDSRPDGWSHPGDRREERLPAPAERRAPDRSGSGGAAPQ